MRRSFQSLVTALALALTPASAFAITVTNDSTGTGRATFGATDTIDWAQLGPNFTSVPSPTAVVSNNGINATVSAPGTMERRDLNTGWGGNFTDGSNLLWNRGTGTMTIDFATAIGGLGFQINPNYSDTTTYVSLFDSALASLGSFFLTTNNRSTASASFLGFTSTTDDIARVTISQSGHNDFTINQLSLRGGIAPVPVPGTLPLLVGAIGFLGFRRRRKTA